MPFARFAVTPDPLAVDRVAAELEREAQRTGEGCGALNAFVGVVRATHKGRRVRYLEYEAFVPLALKAFAKIEAEIREEWRHALIAIHHRVGRMEVGEASVVIVAAAAHRAESFQVCRYAIERVKQIAPVWKHEFFDNGDAWVEGATTDAEDDMARRRAKETACA
jgi:molybdopterin synthase catalytic subunit